MNRDWKFKQWQVKYFIKSPLLYYSFLILFVAIFLYATQSLKLDIRQSFSASIDGNVVSIKSEEEIHSLDGVIYVYNNRNEKVVPQSISKTLYSEGMMNFYLNENNPKISGNVTIEIISGKQSLFSKIFTEAGTNR